MLKTHLIWRVLSRGTCSPARRTADCFSQFESSFAFACWKSGILCFGISLHLSSTMLNPFLVFHTTIHPGLTVFCKPVHIALVLWQRNFNRENHCCLLALLHMENTFVLQQLCHALFHQRLLSRISPGGCWSSGEPWLLEDDAPGGAIPLGAASPTFLLFSGSRPASPSLDFVAAAFLGWPSLSTFVWVFSISCAVLTAGLLLLLPLLAARLATLVDLSSLSRNWGLSSFSCKSSKRWNWPLSTRCIKELNDQGVVMASDFSTNSFSRSLQCLSCLGPGATTLQAPRANYPYHPPWFPSIRFNVWFGLGC